MIDPNRAPVPLPHENTITTVESGAELTLTIPDAPPSASSTGGGSGGSKKLTGTGGIWLTDQRLIFVAPATNASFESLSVPLLSIMSTSFEQPYFGSNYLSVDIKPSPDGGLTFGTKAEIRLKDRGIFEFVSVVEKTRERAIYMKRQAANDEDTLPVYEASTGSPAPSAPAGPSATSNVPPENPPGYDA